MRNVMPSPRACLKAALAVMVLLCARPTPAPTLSRVGDTPTARKGGCLVVGQDGKVYALLGQRPAGGAFVTAVDVYDVRTGRWATAVADPAPGTAVRVGATATLLRSGEVLITGGVNAAGQVLSTTLIFDPRAADGSKWTEGSGMTYRRTRHSATLLKDGKVIVSGGVGCLSSGSCTEGQAPALGVSEIYDPLTRTFLPPQAMPLGAERYDHVSVMVPDGHDLVTGDVRVFGGFQGTVGGPHVALESALLYSGGNWCWAASLYSTQKGARTLAPLLADGRIAILGGTADGATPVPGLTIYDPRGFCGTETMMSIAPPPGYIPRWGATANTLTNGRVLIAGGQTGPTATADVLQVLRFDPAGASVEATTPAAHRTDHNAAVLPTSEVLVVGGRAPDAGLPPPAPDVLVVEKYDPSDGRYCTLAPIGGLGTEQPLRGSTARPLTNGRVLVAFGDDQTNTPTRQAFVFDPETGPPGSCPEQPQGAWIDVTDRPIAEGGAAADDGGVARRGAPGVLLRSGAVLVVGGDGGGGGGGRALSSVRIFNPADTTAGPWGTWRDGAPMNRGRRGHTATLLKDGKVFVFGGVDETETVLDIWEIYDPQTNRWTDGANLSPIRRTGHSATLLRTGDVLIVGGRDESGTIQADTGHFDPGSDPFEGIIEEKAPMTRPRAGASCVALPSDPSLPGGRVLVAFGDTPAGPTNTSEVYDPGTDAWTPTDPLKDGRQARGAGHRSIILVNGKVLAVAGIETPAPGAVEQEIYDPELNEWFGTATDDPLGTPWNDPAAVVLLPSGRALVAGGAGLLGQAIPDARGLTLGLELGTPRPVVHDVIIGSVDAAVDVYGLDFHGPEVGTGANYQLSSAACPSVSLRSIESDVTHFLPPDRNAWTDTTYHGTLPAGMIPGQYRLTLVAAGVPSNAKIVAVRPPCVGEPCDLDGDWVSAPSDCDDANPLVWSQPGEVHNLALTHDRATATTTLRWQAPAVLGSVAVEYDTLMSPDPADFVASAVCIESDEGTDTKTTTVSAPAPGEVHCYLVRAQNACPAGEGSLGHRSDGAPRLGRACP